MGSHWVGKKIKLSSASRNKSQENFWEHRNIVSGFKDRTEVWIEKGHWLKSQSWVGYLSLSVKWLGEEN